MIKLSIVASHEEAAEFLQSFKQELRLYRSILSDSRTPWVSKILLGGAVGYAVSPVDLIPDFIPVVTNSTNCFWLGSENRFWWTFFRLM